MKIVKAAVLKDFNQDFELEELEQAEPEANEVRVKLVSCGICHTENAYRTKLWGTPLKMPIVLGHEGACLLYTSFMMPWCTRFALRLVFAMLRCAAYILQKAG